MPKAPYIDQDGTKSNDIELSEAIFDAQVNVPVMHEVVRAQLAAARAGTQSTKTRAEVRGGGKKPWRQKGTGRARHGSIREPSWVGGGVAHGPKPRSYEMRVNKKVKALALRSALTDRVREGKLLIADLPSFETPATKKAMELLSSWGVEGNTLIVVDGTQESEQLNAWKSFRNLPRALVVTYPTAYTVLAADTVVFTKSALDSIVSTLTTGGSSTRTPKAKAKVGGAALKSPKEGEAPDGADSGGSTRPTESTEAAGTARLEAPAEDSPGPEAAGTARLEAAAEGLPGPGPVDDKGGDI
ncbi:MAG: 50S ribosomal protein L4 [Actinomycetota bacterium]|nr:50S ribosomal protein L4 [Actinomycetota bacterium]